jgi:hypothetical protein
VNIGEESEPIEVPVPLMPGQHPLAEPMTEPVAEPVPEEVPVAEPEKVPAGHVGGARW